MTGAETLLCVAEDNVEVPKPPYRLVEFEPVPKLLAGTGGRAGDGIAGA